MWRDLVYEQPHIWRRMVARLDFSHIRRTSTLDDRIRWIRSLNRRSFDSVVVHGALDQEIAELPHAFASFSNLRSVALHCCGCNDSSLQQLLISCSTRLERLELISCNELSDGGHWLTACTQLNALSIADCINIADETIMAIGQTLPHLVELSVQAYHVTDQCFQYMRINSHLPNSQGFSSADMEAKLVAIEEKAIDDRIAEARLRRERRLRGSPTATRRSIRTEDQWSESVDSPLQALLLNNCWELSNQAMVQLAHCLPNLRYLSLSGCSKVTDEAIELIAQHLKHLQHIDLSWCHRLSDASLEFLACDLGDTLAELMLDRCTGITDIGLSYVAAIRSLKVLTLRWCLQLRDVGIQSLSPLSGLHVLSLSGCSMLTPNAFRSMDQLTSLKELELINCPAATDNLMVYLGQQLPSNCVIIK